MNDRHNRSHHGVHVRLSRRKPDIILQDLDATQLLLDGMGVHCYIDLLGGVVKYSHVSPISSNDEDDQLLHCQQTHVSTISALI